MGAAAVYLKLTGRRFDEHNILGMVRLVRTTRCHGMRKLFTLIFVMVAVILAGTLAPCSRAQAPNNAAELRELAKEKEVKQDELVNLEKDTARSLQLNSAMLFRRVYGEDFVGILPTGQVLDKAGWIASVENSGTQYSSFIASDVRVRMFEETAVVTCLWSSHGTKNGRAFSRQSRVTHVYIWGQRGWQVIASQETLLPGQS
jgi:ketosteroid isomerase-like protein